MSTIIFARIVSLLLSIHSIEFIAVTETLLNDTVPDQLIYKNNYNIFRNDRSYSRGGGVCTFISTNIPAKRRIDLENPSHECLWIWLSPHHLLFSPHPCHRSWPVPKKRKTEDCSIQSNVLLKARAVGISLLSLLDNLPLLEALNKMVVCSHWLHNYKITANTSGNLKYDIL